MGTLKFTELSKFSKELVRTSHDLSPAVGLHLWPAVCCVWVLTALQHTLCWMSLPFQFHCPDYCVLSIFIRHLDFFFFCGLPSILCPILLLALFFKSHCRSPLHSIAIARNNSQKQWRFKRKFFNC